MYYLAVIYINPSKTSTFMIYLCIIVLIIYLLCFLVAGGLKVWMVKLEVLTLKSKTTWSCAARWHEGCLNCCPFFKIFFFSAYFIMLWDKWLQLCFMLNNVKWVQSEQQDLPLVSPSYTKPVWTFGRVRDDTEMCKRTTRPTLLVLFGNWLDSFTVTKIR